MEKNIQVAEIEVQKAAELKTAQMAESESILSNIHALGIQNRITHEGFQKELVRVVRYARQYGDFNLIQPAIIAFFPSEDNATPREKSLFLNQKKEIFKWFKIAGFELKENKEGIMSVKSLLTGDKEQRAAMAKELFRTAQATKWYALPKEAKQPQLSQAVSDDKKAGLEKSAIRLILGQVTLEQLQEEWVAKDIATIRALTFKDNIKKRAMKTGFKNDILVIDSIDMD